LILPVTRRALDVAILRALVSTAQQNNYSIALSTEVHSIPWAKMNAQLEESVAERASITEVPQSHTGDPLPDPVPRCPIPKAPEPVCKRLAAVRAGIDKDIPLFQHRARVALKLLYRHTQLHASIAFIKAGGGRSSWPCSAKSE